MVAVAAVLIIASAIVWWLPRSAVPGAQVHSSVLPPEGQQFDPNDFALSPDGSMIAYTTVGQRGGLWIRRLATGKDEQLPGTDPASFPFWSPDSRSIGFFSNSMLRRVDVAGGPAVTLAEVHGERGATWGADGTILFAPDYGKSGLRRVSAQGGPRDRRYACRFGARGRQSSLAFSAARWSPCSLFHEQHPYPVWQQSE